jgi:hypothetical protein
MFARQADGQVVCRERACGRWSLSETDRLVNYKPTTRQYRYLTGSVGNIIITGNTSGSCLVCKR